MRKALLGPRDLGGQESILGPGAICNVCSQGGLSPSLTGLLKVLKGFLKAFKTMDFSCLVSFSAAPTLE